LKGHPFLVFFGFTHCPDVCPTTLFAFRNLRALGPDADRTRALFVTVDPERDTAPVIRITFELRSPPLRLRGSGQIAAVAKAYRVYYKKVPMDQGGYTMDHTAIVYSWTRTAASLRRSTQTMTEAAAADLRHSRPARYPSRSCPKPQVKV
jgi:protein SCO1/2